MTEFASLSIKIDSSGVSAADDALKDLARSGEMAEKATDELGSSFDRSTRETRAYTEASKQATQGSLLMRGGAQQLGYQIQDVAVQLQSGTSAMVVFGQQGSQIASLFGPTGAFIGAFIAVGAAIGGTLVKSLFNAKSATEELEAAQESLNAVMKKGKDGAFELTDQLIQLYQIDQGLANMKLESAMLAQADAIKLNQEAVSELAAEYRTTSFWADEHERITTSAAAKLQDEFSLTADEAARLGDALDNAVTTQSADAVDNFKNVLTGLTTGTEQSRDALKRWGGQFVENFEGILDGQRALQSYNNLQEILTRGTNEGVSKLQDYMNALAEEEAQLYMSARGVALYQAQKLGGGEAEFAAINRIYDHIEALKAERDAMKASTSSGGKDNSAAQAERERALFESKQDAAQDWLDTVMLLNAEEEEIVNSKYNKMKEKALALYAENLTSYKEYNDALTEIDLKRDAELQSIAESRENAKSSFGESVLSGFGDNPATFDGMEAQIEDEFARRWELIQESTILEDEQRTALETELTERRINALAQLEMQRQQMILTNSANLFDGLASIAKTFKGEQSGIYKDLFAVSKAFAVAQAGIALWQNIAEASKVGFPQNIPLIIGATAQGAQIISGLGGQNFSGAYDDGGTIPSGSFGLVAERGSEFANGQLIQGPAKITSRKDTEAMLEKAAASREVNIKQVLVTDPSFIKNYLQTEEGEEIFITYLSENRETLRSLVA